MFSSKNCDKTSAVFDSLLHPIFHYLPKNFDRAWHFHWNVGLYLDTFEVFRLIYTLENVRIIKRKKEQVKLADT
jgi:hypothetical protein